jgi:hypothetical protein
MKINGGAALTTSNQTGTGSLVLATNPTLQSGAMFNQGAATGPAVSVGGSAVETFIMGATTPSGCCGWGGTIDFTANPGPSPLAGYGVWMTQNAYWNGTAWKQPSGANSIGSHGFTVNFHKNFSFNVAAASGTDGSSISWTEVANIDNAGRLTLNGGVNNSGGGLKHVRAASCTTSNATNPASCNTTITWPSAWPDTNYTAVCTADQTGSAAPFGVIAVFNKTTTQISVSIQDSGGSASTNGIIHCIGMHD